MFYKLSQKLQMGRMVRKTIKENAKMLVCVLASQPWIYTLTGSLSYLDDIKKTGQTIEQVEAESSECLAKAVSEIEKSKTNMFQPVFKGKNLTEN